MTSATLTPTWNQTPAVVNIADQLSGPQWVPCFPASVLTSDLTPAFRSAVDSFLAALTAGGGKYKIANTLRPRERAYLMHWAHKIYRNGTAPSGVPAMTGVHIQWQHATLAASVDAAKGMVERYGIGHLAANTPPALDTLHTSGCAIDMSITWNGHLQIAKKDGTVININSLPRTGMNAQLHEVGRGYGVIKFVGGDADRPHWSTTGH